MRRSIANGIMLATAMIAVPALAADIDGKQPLICALIDLQSCEPGTACQVETAAGLNLPTILRIDIAAKTIAGEPPDGSGMRQSPIDTVRQNDQGFVLQGIDADRSWNAVIDLQGTLSVAAVGPDAGFIIFGNCVTR